MTVRLKTGDSTRDRTISVTLQSPTLLQALNAMSRAGELSWKVSYVATPGSANVARVELVATDTAYVLIPPRKQW
jgi:hypothetical protein